MDELITFACYAILIWTVLKSVAQYYATKITIQEMKEELDEKIRVVKLETSPHGLLAYDAENQQFLAQGANEVELKKNIVTRFPTKIFLLSDKPFSAELISVANVNIEKI